MAINAVVSSESITVFGPPEIIEIGLDVGATGQRGSLIYSGFGDPSINTGVFINEPPIIGDIYIRTDSGADYGVVYQYNFTPSGNEWQSILKITPTIYSNIEEVEFVSGSASILIPLNNIYPDPPSFLAPENFSIHLTSEYSEASAISIVSKQITTGISKSLVINLKGTRQDIENGTTALNDTINLNILISIVI